jgi:hypothetical protein
MIQGMAFKEDEGDHRVRGTKDARLDDLHRIACLL